MATAPLFGEVNQVVCSLMLDLKRANPTDSTGRPLSYEPICVVDGNGTEDVLIVELLLLLLLHKHVNSIIRMRGHTAEMRETVQ